MEHEVDDPKRSHKALDIGKKNIINMLVDPKTL